MLGKLRVRNVKFCKDNSDGSTFACSEYDNWPRKDCRTTIIFEPVIQVPLVRVNQVQQIDSLFPQHRGSKSIGSNPTLFSLVPI